MLDLKWSPTDQARFIKQSLGPAFRKYSISTKIIIFDHNCDTPDYPITILNDSNAKQYVDGSAFHWYGGNVKAMSYVHDLFTDKNIYFTELVHQEIRQKLFYNGL
jgi:glucosylceramidase